MHQKPLKVIKTFQMQQAANGKAHLPPGPTPFCGWNVLWGGVDDHRNRMLRGTGDLRQTFEIRIFQMKFEIRILKVEI